MTLSSRLIVGLIAIASFPLISSGTEGTSTSPLAPRVYTDTEITYIRGLNCDTLTTDAKARCLDIKKAALSQVTTITRDTLPPPVRTESGTDDRHPQMPPPGSQTGSDDRHPPMDPVSNSGTLAPKPPKPPMGSGTEMDHPTEGIGMAIGKLSPTDRDALLKMIREYLTAKGVNLTEFADKKDEVKEVKKESKTEIKEVKKEARTEIKTIRTTTQNTAKMKREEMRKKITEIRNGSGATR